MTLVDEVTKLKAHCAQYGKKVMRQEANMLKVIKRNREQRKLLAAKDDLLTQNQITIQMHHSNVLELQKELDRWQKISIDERAKSNTYRAIAISSGYPEKCHAVPDTGDLGQAAKELGLQVKQEAGYLERLENEYLHLKSFVLWDRQGKPLPWCIAYDGEEEQAQAALEKIRKG
jgi:hypothetical protein